MMDKIDDLLKNIIFSRIKALSPPTAEQYYKSRKNDEKRDYTHGAINIILNSTSTLLTHISAMIAVLGIMLIIFQSAPYTKSFIIIEMILYTFLAMACVYNMRWRGFIKNDAEQSIEGIYNIYMYRRYIYQIVSDGVIYVTMLFIITLIGHLAFSDF